MITANLYDRPSGMYLPTSRVKVYCTHYNTHAIYSILMLPNVNIMDTNDLTYSSVPSVLPYGTTDSLQYHDPHTRDVIGTVYNY